MEATKPLIPNLSKSLLGGMPSMDLGENCKENLFYNIIMNLTDKSSKTENLGLLKRIFEISDNTALRLNFHFNLDDVRLGTAKKLEKIQKFKE